MMSLIREIKENSCILAEASVIEKLRRSEGVDLHPRLENALLVYDAAGRKSLHDVYKAYVEVAYDADLPIIVSSPTWRANRQRTLEVTAAKGINRDAIRFLNNIRNEYDTFSPKIFIGGLIGCKNDCYKPEEALQTDEAYTFHSWQIGKLANEDVDYLMAATLPALPEAVGIARAMGKTKIPYFISFVINRNGNILDGCSLQSAFEKIDDECSEPPMGYMINCAYPSFLNADTQPYSVLERLLGYQANASSLDHDQLDGAHTVQSDSLEDWGNRMIALNKNYGIQILGGCCGTDVKHLRYIAAKLSTTVHSSTTG